VAPKIYPSTEQKKDEKKTVDLENLTIGDLFGHILKKSGFDVERNKARVESEELKTNLNELRNLIFEHIQTIETEI